MWVRNGGHPRPENEERLPGGGPNLWCRAIGRQRRCEGDPGHTVSFHERGRGTGRVSF
jgi:hypothetical protein